MPEEEDEKEKEVLANAKPKIEFYKSLGKAICHRQPGEVAEQWKGPDCVLTVKLTGKAFRMSGRYERQANPLSSAFGVMLASPVKTVTYEITYEGRLEGHVINAEVVRSSDRPKSLLDSSEIKTQVIMVLSDDLKSIAVMENPHSSSPSFYSMTALLTDATR